MQRELDRGLVADVVPQIDGGVDDSSGQRLEKVLHGFIDDAPTKKQILDVAPNTVRRHEASRDRDGGRRVRSLGDDGMDPELGVDVGEEALVIRSGLPRKVHPSEVVTDELELTESQLD